MVCNFLSILILFQLKFSLVVISLLDWPDRKFYFAVFYFYIYLFFTKQAFRKALESVEKLLEVTVDGLPDTMASVRQSGLEISDLTRELSDLG